MKLLKKGGFMEETGIVVETHGMIAKVSVTAQKGCDRCPGAGFCQYGGSGERIIEVFNPLDARKGDTVKVSVPSKSSIFSAFFVFVMPILLALIGIGTGGIFKKEVYEIIGGVIGIVVGIVLVKLIDKWMKKSEKFRPRIVEIYK